MSTKIDVKSEIQKYEKNIKERLDQNTRDKSVIQMLQGMFDMGITELSSQDTQKSIDSKNK